MKDLQSVWKILNQILTLEQQILHQIIYTGATLVDTKDFYFLFFYFSFIDEKRRREHK
jgi:hypothetical protein